MNYRHIYMLIIEHAKSEQKLGLRPISKLDKKNFPNQYFELHHILPRSLFPNWINKKSNIVALTAREHFFCHQLLIKIFPTIQMFCAFWQLCNCSRLKSYTQVNSREYERIKIKISRYFRNKMALRDPNTKKIMYGSKNSISDYANLYVNKKRQSWKNINTRSGYKLQKHRFRPQCTDTTKKKITITIKLKSEAFKNFKDKMNWNTFQTISYVENGEVKFKKGINL